jgi:hypothetical protein
MYGYVRKLSIIQQLVDMGQLINDQQLMMNSSLQIVVKL